MNLMFDWLPDVMFADPSTPAGLRLLLQARYQHLVLTFTVPPVSVSGRFEASWNGGHEEADTEESLLGSLLTALQDCGDKRHDWVTRSEIPDPGNPDNVLRTQRLQCPYCDARDRVITVSSPLPDTRQG
jgi:hypothetical protein